MKYIVLLLLLILIGCTSDDDTLVIGFIPSERAEEITPNAQALADFLEVQLDREVEIVVPSSYEPLLEGIRFGHIDFAYMDAGPAWIAHQQSKANVILAEVKDNRTHYDATLFVGANSDLNSLEDLKGTRIAFTSLTGSSGFIMPIGSLIKEKLIVPKDDTFPALQDAIDEFFSQNVVSGGYAQSLSLLLENRVDVVGGAHDAPQRFLSEVEQQQIRELARLGKVPSHAVIVADHVPAATSTEFVMAMMQLNQPKNQQILLDLYGVNELTITNTQDHLGEFGPVFEGLKGIREMILS